MKGTIFTSLTSVNFHNQNGSVHQKIDHTLDIEIEVVDYKLNKNG